MDSRQLLCWLVMCSLTTFMINHHYVCRGSVIKFGQLVQQPCSGKSISPAMLADPSRVKVTVSSHLLCAVSCCRSELCSHAMSLASNGDNTVSCTHIPRIQLQKPPGLAWFISAGECVVFSKTIEYRRATPGSSGQLWDEVDLADLKGMHDAKFAAMKVSEIKTTVTRHTRVSDLVFGTDGEPVGAVCFTRRFRFNSAKKTYNKPQKIPIVSLLENGNNPAHLASVTNSDGKSQINVITDPVKLLKRNTKRDAESTMFLYTIPDVIRALMDGHRRMERGACRYLVDEINGDVHFDSTERISISSLEELHYPIYVTSIKESMKDEKRYLFKYQVNNGYLLSSEETHTPDAFWVMDTAWSAVEPSSDSREDLVEALTKHVLDGTEVRVVMGNVSSDVTFITVTSADVIFTLAPYLTPFTGAESKQASGQRVQFSAVSAAGIHVQCEMEFQSYTVYNINKTVLSASDVKWFYSTKNWTKLIEIGADGNVVLGDLESLRKALAAGRNIRLCVVFTSKLRHCHVVPFMTEGNDGSVQAHSFPRIMTVTDDSDILSTLHSKCFQKTFVMSTSGFSEKVIFLPGWSDIKEKAQSYISQTWFAEED